LDNVMHIAALMWRIGDNDDNALGINNCVEFVPDAVLNYAILTSEQIHNGMRRYLPTLSYRTATELDFKIDVLDILKRWPMFGASFYQVKCDTEPKLGTSCIVAVNRAGVHFLDPDSQRCILSYPFTEIISTKKIQTDTKDSLDIKVGNNRIQKVIRIDTTQGHDIIHIIGQYIKCLNKSVKLSS